MAKESRRTWGLLLAGTLALLIFGGARAWLHRAAREGIYPLENASAWWRGAVWVRVSRVLSAGQVSARNRVLEAEVARLRLEAAAVERIAAENLALRQQLGFAPPTGGRLEPCLVLSRGGSTGWWRDVRVNKGRRHGLAVGDVVLAPDGLVGRVADLTDTTAEVRLITDANSRVACQLDPPPPGAGTVRGVLYGSGWHGGAPDAPELLYVIEPLRLRYLDRDVEPPPRTRVVTSGLGGGLPAGLPVGHLLATEVDENGLYRIGEVAPAVDFASLSLLFVLVGRGGA